MRDVAALLDIMARLREPQGGCPWDLEQSFETIAPYTIEEAYEVADAVARGDREALRDELGDLLLQVVFHARMAEEEGSFRFDDVVEAICDKLVRRHPHVFGDASVETAEDQTRSWDALKAAEREAAAVRDERPTSAVDDVPLALPALLRSAKLQRRMARAGFEWGDEKELLDKLAEEAGKLRRELAAGDMRALSHELGDVLFVVAGLARRRGVDPEAALREANARVEARFRHVEARLAGRGLRVADASDEELAALWRQAKELET
jgi:MazG family protein